MPTFISLKVVWFMFSRVVPCLKKRLRKMVLWKWFTSGYEQFSWQKIVSLPKMAGKASYLNMFRKF